MALADFGLMGPMLRHFGQDPTPAEIMRNEAPAVFDWLSRVWNARHFEMTVQGCRYLELPVSRYRTYCLEQLRAAFSSLDADARSKVQSLLPYPEAGVLWQPDEVARSGYDEAGEAPFNKAINVYGDGVPE